MVIAGQPQCLEGVVLINLRLAEFDGHGWQCPASARFRNRQSCSRLAGPQPGKDTFALRIGQARPVRATIHPLHQVSSNFGCVRVVVGFREIDGVSGVGVGVKAVFLAVGHVERPRDFSPVAGDCEILC